MIHALTMSTGSACTVGVVGAYWMSSMSSLRRITLPGVVATSCPGLNASVPAGGSPRAPRAKSSTPRAAPVARLTPQVAAVLCSTCGLVAKMLAGETISSHCRTMNATNCS